MSIQVCDVLKVVTISRNKITSVTADNQHIFVSCKDGKLMIYQLMDSSPLQFSEKPSISMFSGVKKGALMMKCVLKWNLLFALNDKGIAIHKLDDLEHFSYLPNSSGCSFMAIDESRQIVVASCKRKILVYQMREGISLSQTYVKEIILSDAILCMSFLNSLLFVGSKKEYCLVDIAQGRSVKDICDISKNTIYPFCIPIQQYDGTINSSFGETENDNKEQGEMLLANDRKGLFYDFVGSPARGKGQHLEWLSDAISGVYLCPYFLALTTTGIEVHNSWRYQRIQKIDFSSPKMIEEFHFTINNQSIDGAVVCSQQSVILLQMQSLSQQIMTLISDQYKCFDDALTLCSLFPRGKEQIRDQFKTQISRLKGLYLFSEGKYDTAISFLQKGMVPTTQVLSLYPSIIPDSVPTNISPYPPRIFASKLEENTAIEALLPLLNSRKQQLLLKLQQVQKMNSDQTESSSLTADSSGYSLMVHLDLQNEDEEEIVKELTLIDNVLLRAYIKTNRPAIIPLFHQVNFCSFEDSQKLLAEAGMEPELIALYSSHHKHDLAIAQILAPLSNPDIAPIEKQRRLQELLHYIQKLGRDYQELIFDCSRMFYKESRQLVLELFVGYHAVDGGEAIDNSSILSHLHELSQNDKQIENQWERNALEITFLRNLIFDKENTEVEFHTQLVYLYTSSVGSLQSSVEAIQERVNQLEQQDQPELQSLKDDLYLILSQREELLLRCKKEFLEFLEISNYYDAAGILQKLENTQFLEERAIILSKLGEYLNALEIIAHQLGNIDMAEAYCMKLYRNNHDSSIFMHLIKTFYLFPPDNSCIPKEGCCKLALRIFSNHADKVDPIEVINLLPENLPLDDMSESIEIVMTKLDEKRRNMLMMRKLAEVRRLDVSEEYINTRNTVFENTTSTICPVCKRMIGISVFTWNSDGTVMHTACARQK